MRDLPAAGLPVALVIGGVGAQDPDGIEVLAAVRQIDPAALRVATVRWGDWESVRSIFEAVSLGKIDHWVTVLCRTRLRSSTARSRSSCGSGAAGAAVASRRSG